MAQPGAHATTPADSEPMLAAHGLVVEYPGVRALDRVDFEVRAGEVHALMGENGAGKSTLVRVLSGLRRADAGSIRVGGRPVRVRSPRDAEGAGISTVHQEVDLIPTMSVADNICLGRQPARFGLIRPRAVRGRARAALERLGLEVDPTCVLGDLPIATRQMVAMARALDIESRVLILDEPTSSLDADESRALFSILKRLKARGLGIVLVTHFLDQVYEIADRVSVLRNAALVGVWRTAELSRSSLVEAMTGRSVERGACATGASGAAPGAGAPALSFKGIARARAIEPVSGTVRRGEALGLAGLLGSGRTELARLLFGADRPDRGEVRAGDSALRLGSIHDAIRHGLAFTPEDRTTDGVILDLSVLENIILALQARRGPLRPLPRAERNRLAVHYIDALRIRAPGPGWNTPVRHLSGGNQQKVLLARWLAVQPSVLILDEPTRGIDVGARAEIERLIADLRAAGLAVVLISSELDEIARVCGRVLVLRDRGPVGELTGGEISECRILQLIAHRAPTRECS